MIAFWVGVFAVVMLFLMCISPDQKWSGRNLSASSSGEVKPPRAHMGGYSARPTGKGPRKLPKGGSGQSK
jgi:hypothetical protein